MSPSRLGSWKTMPKLLRAWSWFTWGSRPSSQILPEVGCSSVVNILMVVVLPAPLGPRKAKISPLATSNDTLATAVKSPNFFTSCCTRIIETQSPGAIVTATQRSKSPSNAVETSTHNHAQEFRILNGSVQYVNPSV